MDTDVMITYGASTRKLKKGEFIFEEGGEPRFFFKILTGAVKMCCMNEDGKEFIQGIYKADDSFGEPPLFLNRPYPSSAVTLEDTVLLKLSKDKLFSIINDYPGVAKKLLQIFAQRVYDKAITVQILTCPTPEQKILTFLEKLKSQAKVNTKFLIPYTRQQIADFTGLRVETVIRTLSKMKNSCKVDIINHKLYY